MGPSGFVALLAGWFVTETGRQPYTVYGLLRTADSVSPIGAPGVALSLIAFVAVYLSVFGMGIWYLLRLMRRRSRGDAGRAHAHAETAPPASPPLQATQGPASRPMSYLTDLAIIWSAILAFAIYAYVVLDGFDLGIGILAPFARSDGEEKTMISRSRRYGTATRRGWCWAAAGYGGLSPRLLHSAAGPLRAADRDAAGVDLPWRRLRVPPSQRGHRRIWTFSFVLGSYVAAMAQGIALGTFVQGIEVDGRAYAGGWFDWLTPFSIFTGLALILGYALLGACFLIMKSEGLLQARMFRLGAAARCGRARGDRGGQHLDAIP